METEFNPIIYDIEVTAQDWLVVARDLQGGPFTVVHNNAKQLRELLLKDDFYGGFNNKHYDDGMVTAMMNNADNKTVKELNDWIIEKRELYWTHPFMKNKYKDFESFDSRDDIDVGLSLKAIEANKGMSIVESSVPFTIKTKWTEAELMEMISYAKVDVDATREFIKEDRLSYLMAKKSVGARVGLTARQAMSMTNAKLSAKFLGAVKTEYTDGDDVLIADTLDIGKYNEVLAFFMKPKETFIKILESKRDSAKTDKRRASFQKKIDKFKKNGQIADTELSIKVAGVTHKYAWGGIHGARPKYYAVADGDYIILLIDVGSYYPSMMIEYNFISRSIPNSDDFVKVYNQRMAAKLINDFIVSNDLKLVLNTAYGAMKNKYNDLYDPRAANSICASGQLLLTDLIDKLEAVKSMTLIQSNTDGIMIKVKRSDTEQTHGIVSEWEKRTRMNMEYTEVLAIAQKDVNNYVMVEGDVYIIKDGQKVIEKPGKNKINAIGSWLNKWDGGSFKNNSMSVIDKALVYKIIYGHDIAETINAETDPIRFQLIAKSGSTYDFNTHEVDGQRLEVQKVNRVYAAKNHKLGKIYKHKAGGNKRGEMIQNLPEHCIIDNEATMTVAEIDKQWYIDLATERLQEVVGKRNVDKLTPALEYKKANKKEDINMSKENATPAKKTIYHKLNDIRADFLANNPKKTGVNEFSEFEFFELKDIVPLKQELSIKHGLTDFINFTEDTATLTVIDLDDVNEGMSHIEFTTSIDKLVIKGMNTIQAIGSVHTYMRRYLYMLYLDIIEPDIIDNDIEPADDPEPVKKKETTKKKPKASTKPATPTERKKAKETVINKEGEADAATINSIKRGLSKYRELDGDETYISKVVALMKAQPTNDEANDILTELGAKIQELQ